VAHPQPERSEFDPTVGGSAPIPSLADAHPAGASPDAVWLTMCAWCDRLKVRDRWVAGSPALAMIDGSGTHQPQVTHGICPTCFVDAVVKANRDRQARDEA
jgi:hypothetical protein